MKKIKDFYMIQLIVLVTSIASIILKLPSINLVLCIGLLLIIIYQDRVLTMTKNNLIKISGHYINKMTFEQLSIYLDTIITRTIIQAIREDVPNPKNISKTERYRMIVSNSFVRYLSYFQTDIAVIDSIYGKDYLTKHYNFFIDELIASENMDKLYDKYVSN